MTQHDSQKYGTYENMDTPTEPVRSSRIANAEPDTFDPSKPRLGRRESEPHSAEVSYLYCVLKTNFPESRVIWDLHHFFMLNGEEIDIQFDISFFKDWAMPQTLSSYHANRYNNRIPLLVINVLSKNTWRSDLSENLEICKQLRIPFYVIFAPFHVTSNIYKPPFLRVYVLRSDGEYDQHELRTVSIQEGNPGNPTSMLDFGASLPFRIGLMELKQHHFDGRALYRLVLFDSKENKILLNETQKAQADAQKAQADAQKAQADAQKAQTELLEYKKKFGLL